MSDGLDKAVMNAFIPPVNCERIMNTCAIIEERKMPSGAANALGAANLIRRSAMSSILKTCRICKQEKPLSEFHKRKGSPDGRRNDCKACHYKASRQWVEQNREKDREYKLAYYYRLMSTPEGRREVREYHRRYYQKNAENRRAVAARYRNSPHGKAKIKQYRQRQYVKQQHRQRMRSFMQTEEWKDYKQEWRTRNRDKVREYCQKRRAIIRGSEGEFSLEQWRKLIELAKHRCLCCGHEKSLTVDHIVPVSKGGGSGIDNIQPLCAVCNSSKNDTTVDYRTKEIREWATKQTT